MSWLIVSNVGLFAAVLALGAVVLSVARQIGVLHERTAPAGAALQRARQAQSVAPNALTVTDLTGASTSLGSFADSRPLAMLFIGPRLSRMQGAAARIRTRNRAPRPGAVLRWRRRASRRAGALTRQSMPWTPARYFIGTELAVALKVMHTPTLVVVDGGGRVVLRETLRSSAHLAAAAARLNLARGADGSFGD